MQRLTLFCVFITFLFGNVPIHAQTSGFSSNVKLDFSVTSVDPGLTLTWTASTPVQTLNMLGDSSISGNANSDISRVLAPGDSFSLSANAQGSATNGSSDAFTSAFGFLEIRNDDLVNRNTSIDFEITASVDSFGTLPNTGDSFFDILLLENFSPLLDEGRNSFSVKGDGLLNFSTSGTLRYSTPASNSTFLDGLVSSGGTVSATAVPEPSSLVLLSLVGLTVMSRRRR